MSASLCLRLSLAVALIGGCLSSPSFQLCVDNSGCPVGQVCGTDQICRPADAGARLDGGGSPDSGQLDSGVVGGVDGGLDGGQDGGLDAGGNSGPYPPARYGVTAVRGFDVYGTVFLIGGIDAQGRLSREVDLFQNHGLFGPLYAWTRGGSTPLPSPLAFAAGRSFHIIPEQDGVCLAGGFSDAGATFEVLDSDLGEHGPWSHASREPAPRAFAAGTVDPVNIGGAMLVVGGFTDGGVPTALVESYVMGDWDAGGLFDGGWIEDPSLHHARGGLGADILKGDTSGNTLAPVAFAIGGWELDAGVLVPSAAAEQFDGVAWTDLPPLPVPRGGLAVATDDRHQLFAIGGSTGPFGSPVPSDRIDVFDTDAGTWAASPLHLPTARWGVGAAFAWDGGEGDVIVIFGGQLPDGGVSAETDILNPSTQRLTVLNTGG